MASKRLDDKSERGYIMSNQAFTEDEVIEAECSTEDTQGDMEMARERPDKKPEVHFIFNSSYTNNESSIEAKPSAKYETIDKDSKQNETEKFKMDREKAESAINACKRSGIECTSSDNDEGHGGLEMFDRLKLISATVWVIIICCETNSFDDSPVLMYEENFALFEACRKGLQNVIYLLGRDVSNKVAKGFPSFIIDENGGWLETVISHVKEEPKKICPGMFLKFCFLVGSDQSYVFPNLTSTKILTSKFQDNFVIFKLKIKPDNNFIEYTANLNDDDIKIKRRTSSGSIEDIDTISEECPLLDWTNGTEISLDVEVRAGRKVTITSFVAVGLYYLLILTLVSMCTSAMVITSLEARNIVINIMLFTSLVTYIVFLVLSRLATSRENSRIAFFQMIIVVTSLIMQILYGFKTLPHPVYVPVETGALGYINFLNTIVVWGQFDFGKGKSKYVLKGFAIIYTLGLYCWYCVHLPSKFKDEHVSFRSNLMILFALYFCQIGSLMSINKYFRYFVRLLSFRFQWRGPVNYHDVGTVICSVVRFVICRVVTKLRFSEAVLFFLFMIVWFGPSFAIYGFDNQIYPIVTNITYSSMNTSLLKG